MRDGVAERGKFFHVERELEPVCISLPGSITARRRSARRWLRSSIAIEYLTWARGGVFGDETEGVDQCPDVGKVR
jgi:hypothetical protein